MIDLDDVATRHVGPGVALFRVYRTYREALRARPWHFSSTARAVAGRFDLNEPYGTCYFSDHLAGSWVEVFRGMKLVPLNDVEARSVAVVERRTSDVMVADLTHPSAVSAGVSLDVSAGDDYTQTQTLAAALHRRGWRGAVAWIRHDPAARYRNVALFGRSGSRAVVQGWRVRSEPLVTHAASVAVELGVRVGPIPFDLEISQP